MANKALATRQKMRFKVEPAQRAGRPAARPGLPRHGARTAAAPRPPAPGKALRKRHD
jgi:hypothetical protein